MPPLADSRSPPKRFQPDNEYSEDLGAPPPGHHSSESQAAQVAGLAGSTWHGSLRCTPTSLPGSFDPADRSRDHRSNPHLRPLFRTTRQRLTLPNHRYSGARNDHTFSSPWFERVIPHFRSGCASCSNFSEARICKASDSRLGPENRTIHPRNRLTLSPGVL